MNAKIKQLGSQGGLGYPRKSTRPHVLGSSFEFTELATVSDRYDS